MCLRCGRSRIPSPGPDEVLVAVKAAGINPGEIAIREGRLHERWPATFPSGEGTDFAGVVQAVGAGVSAFAVGDEVLGWTEERASHAELVVVPADQLTAKPTSVSWEVAGSLFVVALRCLRVGPGGRATGRRDGRRLGRGGRGRLGRRPARAAHRSDA